MTPGIELYRSDNLFMFRPMATKKRAAKRRPKAMVLAQHGEKPVALKGAERTLLNEALRRGEDMLVSLEASITSYGRWLLGAIFKDDAKAALDDKSENKVWLELVRRAGGPTLPIERSALYSALRIAALDKHLADDTWRGLGFGRKRLLLPLASDARLRDGARHVAKFKLSHSAIRQYVTAILTDGGRPPALRFTVPALVTRVQKLRETLGSEAALRRAAELRDTADADDRARAARELDELRDVLCKLAKTLRGKG